MDYLMILHIHFVGPKLILLAILTRPILVLLHELGHAIPALILTKQKVEIYMGSYGDRNKNFKIELGLLEIWFTKNPFYWYLGYSKPTAKKVPVNHQILYVLCGPIFPFIISVIANVYLLYFKPPEIVKLGIIIFLVASIIDLFINLIPQERQFRDSNKIAINNDGFIIKKLLSAREMNKPMDDFLSGLTGLAEKVKAMLKVKYDADSIKYLEEFIERQKARYSEDESKSKGLINSCAAFLGQCIIENYGGQWERDDNGQVAIVFDTKNTVYPFEQVSKQFANGLKDSVYSMYTTIPTVFNLPPRTKKNGDSFEM